MSILHRITGIGLAAGTLLLVCWLYAAASGPEAYAAIQDFNGSILGRLLLFGWTVALFYHLCNGMRHLAWDTGWGFDLPTAYLTGWLTLAATAVLTVVAWVVGYAMTGGL